MGLARDHSSFLGPTVIHSTVMPSRTLPHVKSFMPYISSWASLTLINRKAFGVPLAFQCIFALSLCSYVIRLQYLLRTFRPALAYVGQAHWMHSLLNPPSSEAPKTQPAASNRRCSSASCFLGLGPIVSSRSLTSIPFSRHSPFCKSISYFEIRRLSLPSITEGVCRASPLRGGFQASTNIHQKICGSVCWYRSSVGMPYSLHLARALSTFLFTPSMPALKTTTRMNKTRKPASASLVPTGISPLSSSSAACACCSVRKNVEAARRLPSSSRLKNVRADLSSAAA
mmetsp:Transcript_6644/g.24650  ORF Transcript_6644/g.24650 Transcript_6644/m.24650 type:complete len:285 (-) Transcript_6644:222-1076(-)